MHACARSVAQSCLTLCDPMDGSLPGSSVNGILQARILELSFPTPYIDIGMCVCIYKINNYI